VAVSVFKSGVVGPQYVFKRIAGGAFRKVIKPSVAGVRWSPSHNCWVAYLTPKGSRQISLGSFRTEGEAVDARRAAVAKYFSADRVV